MLDDGTAPPLPSGEDGCDIILTSFAIIRTDASCGRTIRNVTGTEARLLTVPSETLAVRRTRIINVLHYHYQTD